MKKLAALLVLLVFTVVACSLEGSRFDLYVVVDHGGDNSLTIRVDHEAVDEADWFSTGRTHQIHDNCDCGGGWDRTYYGEVYDLNGVEIEPNDVPDGACMHIVGQIREDQDGKYFFDRPVYDRADIVSCEMWTS